MALPARNRSRATPPNYFLHLRSAAKADKWLTKNLKFRQIGATELPRGGEYQFRWYAPLSNAFDALFYLPETSASQPYRVAHPARYGCAAAWSTTAVLRACYKRAVGFLG
ncbi:erythromycin esterase family protein [Hymenobacter artigasi]|uniref:erythromycin esterase family protein n=1 Tax=Hymenobacter artigasi TaxID=2719616 RepID=UPI0014469E31